MMKAISEQNILQIDVTNMCPHRCSNCTRFCGHHKKPFVMDYGFFKNAVDCAADFPGGMVGIMGGEPTMIPDFEEYMNYYVSRICPERKGMQADEPGLILDFSEFIKRWRNNVRPRCRRGLFTSLGPKYYQHYETIQDVFPEYQCVNDHCNPGLHQPLLVASSELPIGEEERKALIDKCWINQTWSATVTPKGAFFCEVAAALDMLLGGPGGWPVEKGWWKRKPCDYGDQLKWCNLCGAAIPLPRRRANMEIDDISPGMVEKLKAVGSPKVENGHYQVFEVDSYDLKSYESKWNPDAEWYLPKEGEDGALRVAKENVSISPRKLEGVTVCVGYSDYLKVTLPMNLRHFDKFVVVTDKTDERTIELCKSMGVECVISKRIHENGAPFNKGKAINEGLARLSMEDWVLHLDADTILPFNFRYLLSSSVLNPGCMYYTKRIEMRRTFIPMYLKMIGVNPMIRDLICGAMVEDRGYGPWGYFQLFSANAKSLRGYGAVYPEDSDTAELTDKYFKDKWCEGKQIALPEIMSVVHLHHGEHGVNWKGRKTAEISCDVFSPIPEQWKKSENGWSVLMRSVSPMWWGSGTGIGDDNWGSVIPDYARFIKMVRGRDSIIFNLDGDPKRNSKRMGKYMWVGDLYFEFLGGHLGIVDLTRPIARDPNKTKGNVVMWKRGYEYSGWGFGHRMFCDDDQGFCWNGVPEDEIVVEVSFKNEDLSEDEKNLIIG